MSIDRDSLTADGIDFSDIVDGEAERLAPLHPGAVLRSEFLEPYGLSANALARALDVPPNRVTAILGGTRTITADTALRLARYFGTSPQFWLNLQTAYDLDVATRSAARDIAARVQPRAA